VPVGVPDGVKIICFHGFFFQVRHRISYAQWVRDNVSTVETANAPDKVEGPTKLLRYSTIHMAFFRRSKRSKSDEPNQMVEILT